MTISAQSVPADNQQTSQLDENFAINGDFTIAQAGNSFAGIAAGTNIYPVDNFGCTNNAGAAIITARQTADHPFLVSGKCVEMLVTTADAAVAAADLVFGYLPVEGNDLAKFLNDSVGSFRNFVISFWAKTNIAAGAVNVSCSFSSPTNDRNFPSTFQITNAGVWQYFAIPVVVNNFAAGGTWNLNTANAGANLYFSLMAGANFTGGTADAWNAVGAAQLLPAGGTNICAAVNNYLRIADLKIQRGVIGTTYNRLTFAQQLLQCQRQYWQTFPYGTVPVQNIGNALGCICYRVPSAGALNFGQFVRFPVKMRATPVAVYFNPLAANTNWRAIARAADSGAATSQPNTISAESVYVDNPQVVADIITDVEAIHASFNARM